MSPAGPALVSPIARSRFNLALGGEGKHGGTDGEGIGGGVYNLGTFSADSETSILFNIASTSDDNFGP
jgi:hypothetical protein